MKDEKRLNRVCVILSNRAIKELDELAKHYETSKSNVIRNLIHQDHGLMKAVRR